MTQLTNPWDCYVADAHSTLSTKEVKELGRGSSIFVIFRAAVLWAQLIFGWILALVGPIWTMPVALIIIIVCQQSMILWVHESSHYLIAKSRSLNDFLANLLFASPLGMNVETYRTNHSTHHSYLGTEKDKDRWTYSFDIHNKRILIVVIAIMTGYYGLAVAIRKYGAGLLKKGVDNYSSNRYLKISMSLMWNVSLFIVCFLCGRWWAYFVFWLYPVFSITVLLNVLRTIGEHLPTGYTGNKALLEQQTITRTTIPPLLEKWIFFQANFNYHFEHHVYPGAPCSRLPKIHELLKNRGFYAKYPELVQGSLMTRISRLSFT